MDGLIVHVMPSSLYQQVTDDLLGRITDGRLQPGNPMPTEEALCRQYGVSRITVRRAVAELVARGLVVRRRGVGSFVTGRQPAPREFHLVGFLDDKLAFANRALTSVSGTADERTAAALQIEPGAPVRHISSVVHRDDEPFTVTDAYSVDDPDQRIREDDYGAAEPSPYVMGRRLGRRIESAEQELDAVAADGFAARHLGITEATPVIRAQRVYYSTGRQPILHLVVRYHPDRYRFFVDLVPRAGSNSFEALPHGDASKKAPSPKRN